MLSYKEKYLKYKNKYLNLKNLQLKGGSLELQTNYVTDIIDTLLENGKSLSKDGLDAIQNRFYSIIKNTKQNIILFYLGNKITLSLFKNNIFFCKGGHDMYDNWSCVYDNRKDNLKSFKLENVIDLNLLKFFKIDKTEYNDITISVGEAAFAMKGIPLVALIKKLIQNNNVSDCLDLAIILKKENDINEPTEINQSNCIQYLTNIAIKEIQIVLNALKSGKPKDMQGAGRISRIGRLWFHIQPNGTIFNKIERPDEYQEEVINLIPINNKKNEFLKKYNLEKWEEEVMKPSLVTLVKILTIIDNINISKLWMITNKLGTPYEVSDYDNMWSLIKYKNKSESKSILESFITSNIMDKTNIEIGKANLTKVINECIEIIKIKQISPSVNNLNNYGFTTKYLADKLLILERFNEQIFDSLSQQDIINLMISVLEKKYPTKLVSPPTLSNILIENDNLDDFFKTLK